MPFIKFGRFSTKMWYPFLMGITSFFNTVVTKIIAFYIRKREESEAKRIFVMLIYMFIGEMLAFILFIFQSKEIQIEKEKISINSQSNMTTIPKIKKIGLFKVILIILGVTLLDTFSSFIFNYVKCLTLSFTEFMLRMLLIMITMLISSWMLKIKFGIHQRLSMVTLFTIVIIMFIFTLNWNKIDIHNSSWWESTKNTLILIPIIMVSQIAAGLVECFEKKLMEEYFLSPFLIIMTEGICGLFIIIPISLSVSSLLYSKFKNNVFPTWKGVLKEIKLNFMFAPEALSAVGRVVALFWFNVFRLLTNHSFTPCHRSIADTITTFFRWILSIIGIAYNSKMFGPKHNSENIEVGDIIFQFVIYLVIFFDIAIYIELIILNVCGLETDTSTFIRIREEKEIQSIREIVEELPESNLHWSEEKTD